MGIMVRRGLGVGRERKGSSHLTLGAEDSVRNEAQKKVTHRALMGSRQGSNHVAGLRTGWERTLEPMSYHSRNRPTDPS